MEHPKYLRPFLFNLLIEQLLTSSFYEDLQLLAYADILQYIGTENKKYTKAQHTLDFICPKGLSLD